MKTKQEARVGSRINKNFIGMMDNSYTYWYDSTMNRWITGDNINFDIHMISSHKSVNSIRAFRKALKKAPKNIKFRLVSRYKNHDVFGVGDNINYND